jgi:16S rRNA (cytosine1402-N4)-methyltransferase
MNDVVRDDRPGFSHEPVMRDEIVGLFADVPAGVVVDATVGGGGHSAALLDAHAHLRILGLDRDEVALAAAGERLARFGDRVDLRHERFDGLQDALDDLGIEEISGALFDLGVSSPQLDVGERGFSYRNDGPLDMRMDRTEQWSADDVVNGYTEADLARVLRDHADERFAGRIARAIVAARPIETTVQLAGIVVSAIPAPARRRGGHPAKRTFQAIRIEVNRELDVLPIALDAAIDATALGGRVAVLSYHSGEDRIVKERFRLAQTGGCTCPDGLPCVCGAVSTVRLVRRIHKTASTEESVSNPRAASVRLRAVEKITPAHTGGPNTIPVGEV